MDIFDFAIQMEHDGEQYYRDVAPQPPKKAFRRSC